jgi:cytoskeletal protein CcmA (bactofilin family)
MAETETINTVPATAAATNGKSDEPTCTVISAGDSFKGKLVMQGDGQILGDFDGEIDCAGELMIGPQAQVEANIRTVRLTVSGSIRGNVVATGRMRVTTTGRLEGDARVGLLVVQEGGVYMGLIRVYPEGVPAEEQKAAKPAVAKAVAAAPELPVAQPAKVTPPVERVKKFWGEIF